MVFSNLIYFFIFCKSLTQGLYFYLFQFFQAPGWQCVLFLVGDAIISERELESEQQCELCNLFYVYPVSTLDLIDHSAFPCSSGIQTGNLTFGCLAQQRECCWILLCVLQFCVARRFCFPMRIFIILWSVFNCTCIYILVYLMLEVGTSW